MTIQTNVLEFRLGQMVLKAQQLLAEQIVPAGGLLDDGRAWFDKPDVVAFWRSLEGLDAELRRVLRQFDGLRRQLADMEAKLSAAPHEQRWREQSRIASLEDDLSRVVRRAARLASLLLDLRARGGGISGAELAQAICNIGTEVGKSLDQMTVMRMVQQVSTQPSYGLPGGARPASGGLVESLFVVIAMVSALARRRGARGN
jgi:hypothetical protein